MSLKNLKLTQAAPVATSGDAKGRARAKVLAHLEQQKALVAAHMAGTAFEATRPVYVTNDVGQRVRVMKPVHVRRDWFEDAAGAVHMAIRYGSKPLALDKAGNISVEVGKIETLPGVVEALLGAVRAGELDVQLAAAAIERRKHFGKRKAVKAS